MKDQIENEKLKRLHERTKLKRQKVQDPLKYKNERKQERNMMDEIIKLKERKKEIKNKMHQGTKQKEKRKYYY